MKMQYNNVKKNGKNNGKKDFVTLFTMLYFMVCSGVGGFLFAKVTDELFGGKLKGPAAILVGIGILLLLVISVFIHMFLHECGHLLFGLLSGYSFQSIRWGSIMLMKTEEGIRMARYSLAGTGGQCIMMPPDTSDEDMPTSLYNLGGILVNGVVVILSVILYLIFAKNVYVLLLSAFMVLIGIYLIIVNGIPMASMGNDGYNALHLAKDPIAKHCFKLQLLIVAQSAKNIPITDLPSEWFDWEEKVSDNALIMGQGVNRLEWLVYSKRIQEASELSTFILENVHKLADVLMHLVYIEHISCMIWLGVDREQIIESFEKYKKDILLMRQLPSTQRMLYLFYSYVEADEKKANKAKKQFEKIAANYPYPCEIEIERQLMDLKNVLDN